MGKVLELSDDTYQHLVDLAQQQQRTPEEMLRVCLATYEAARYERVHQQMTAEGLLAALPMRPCSITSHQSTTVRYSTISISNRCTLRPSPS